MCGIYDKINSIDKCMEFSGKSFVFKGINFLGLSYKNSHYLSQLRSLMETKPDIVIAHPESQRWRTIAEYNPKLVIHGHYNNGFHIVNNVKFISTCCFPSYGLISFDEQSKSVKNITYYKSKMLKKEYENGSIVLPTGIAESWEPKPYLF